MNVKAALAEAMSEWGGTWERCTAGSCYTSHIKADFSVTTGEGGQTARIYWFPKAAAPEVIARVTGKLIRQ